MRMTSSRPYMIRSLYEWIVDNSCTPYILVDSMVTGVMVPQEHINKDGQIVLNVAPSAVQGLDLGAEALSFSARFGGIPTDLYVPCSAVLGIYARENGQGMVFEHEPEVDPEPEPPKPTKVSDSGAPKAEKSDSDKRPSLRVVK